MAKCATCGQELSDGTKFCSGCGAAIAAPDSAVGTKCAACGAENPRGGKFCVGCGKPLAQAAPQAPPVSPSKCASCGVESPPGSKFCVSCGAALATIGAVAGPQPVGFTPTATAGATTAAEQELALFVGDNASYYLDKWRTIAQTGKKQNWNWSALIFSSCWLAYRKMYQLAAFVAAAGLVLPLISGLASLLSLVLWVLVGLMGNAFYYDYARKKLAEIKSRYPGQSLPTAELSAVGGTSWPAAIGFAVAQGIGLIIIAMYRYATGL